MCTGRASLVHEANGKLAFRSDNWALIPPYQGAVRNETLNELGNFQQITLWDIANDPAQQEDVAAKNPETVKLLWAEFIKQTEGYFNPKAGDVVLE